MPSIAWLTVVTSRGKIPPLRPASYTFDGRIRCGAFMNGTLNADNTAVSQTRLTVCVWPAAQMELWRADRNSGALW